MVSDKFRLAAPPDIDAIVRLVNGAYRPAADATGWIHERDLVAGDRVNAAQVLDAISKPESAVLICSEGSQVVACIHVEREGDCTHIGMFAVLPPLQGSGVGKQMLAYAESYASSTFASKRYVMSVVSVRSELIAFYSRRGYVRIGDAMEYPVLANAGIPKCDGLQIVMLEKEVKYD